MMLDGLSKVGPRIEKRKCCQDAGWWSASKWGKGENGDLVTQAEKKRSECDAEGFLVCSLSQAFWQAGPLSSHLFLPVLIHGLRLWQS